MKLGYLEWVLDGRSFNRRVLALELVFLIVRHNDERAVM